MTKNKNLMNEIQEIKTLLAVINLSLKQLLNQSMEVSSQILLSHIRDDYARAIENYMVGEIKERLEARIPPSCERREVCKSILGDFLQRNAELIRGQKIDEETIRKKRDDLYRLKRENMIKDECARCFGEAEILLEKQIQLLKSLNIYSGEREDFKELTEIPEEVVVNEILEPIDNTIRFKILKSLTIRERTFSDIMRLTGLRGGNLLFHLQKLLDKGLIIQRHERGDYMITEKGYKILKAIAKLCMDLSIVKVTAKDF